MCSGLHQNIHLGWDRISWYKAIDIVLGFVNVTIVHIISAFGLIGRLLVGNPKTIVC